LLNGAGSTQEYSIGILAPTVGDGCGPLARIGSAR
jgi:hypothetical protein